MTTPDMIPARHKVLGLGLTASILVAHLSGAAAWTWRALDDPNMIRTAEAAASESAVATVDPLVATTSTGQWGQPLNWTPGDCDSFRDLALWAGWTEAEWPRLRRIIWRESRCLPAAHNQRGRDDSRGLAQLNNKGNQLFRGPMRTGFGSLADECGLLHVDALFDPAVSLLCAKALHRAWGWFPWRS